MSQRSKIHGSVTLRMPSGVTHTLSNRLVLQLLNDATTAMGAALWPIPAAIYERFPQLEWFRDCQSAYSEDGDHIFEAVLGMVRPPAGTSVGEGSAA